MKHQPLKNANEVRGRRSTDKLREEYRQRHQAAAFESWSATIPATFQGFTIEEHLAQDLWHGNMDESGRLSILTYLENPTTTLILKGPVGVGKTTLAATLIGQMIWDGKAGTGGYCPMPTITSDMSFGRKEGIDVVRQFSEPDILLLDDVGASNDGLTAFQRQQLWSIINNRVTATPDNHLGRQLTILTTNMSINGSGRNPGLIEWFGAPAWDRIIGNTTFVELFGESLRGV